MNATFSDEELDLIRNSDIDEAINVMYRNAVLDPLGADYVHDFIDNAKHFIDTEIRIKDLVEFDTANVDCGVEQILQGDQIVYTGIFGDKEAILRLASVFGMEDFTEVDADSLDAVSEFLNLTNGLYVSARSDDGIELDLDPPMMYPSEQSVVGDDGTAFRLELDIGAGTLNVVFSVDVDVFVE